MYKKYYHGTTRKMIVAFATMFDNMHIDINDKDVMIPLYYVQGEKFLSKLDKYTDLENTVKPPAMPIMGFEMSSMNYDPERHFNPQIKLQDKRMAQTKQYMFNRMPVTWNFELYIGVRRLNDGFKIIEQILPHFQPHVMLTVRGIEELEQPDNIPAILTSFSHDIAYDGSMDDMRYITFNLSFSLKGYLYPDLKKHATIKDAIVRVGAMTDEDFEDKFMALTVSADEQGFISESIGD
jgi:hypothetical protein